MLLVVHTSTQSWISQCSPGVWQIKWTSDLALVNSIVYSCGSSCVQLFNTVPTHVLQSQGCADGCSCLLLIALGHGNSFCDKGIPYTLLWLRTFWQLQVICSCVLSHFIRKPHLDLRTTKHMPWWKAEWYCTGSFYETRKPGFSWYSLNVQCIHGYITLHLVDPHRRPVNIF